MSAILVCLEHKDQKIKNASLELVGKAHQLASDLSCSVHGLMVGQDLSGAIDQAKSLGLAKLWVAEDASLEHYHPVLTPAVLAQAVSASQAKVVWSTASSTGKDMLPVVTAKVDGAMLSECVDVQIKDGKLYGQRPMYAGKCTAWASVQEGTTALMTFRPNVFEATNQWPEASTETQTLEVPTDTQNVSIVERIAAKSDKVDLTEAAIIVAGGRSLKSAENFSILQEMAAPLNAAVGATRAAVDAGYAPHSMQIGQTGKVVNPKLYFAMGISGAIQHLAGMRTSKVIVTVNTDKDAPLFEKSDYGIVGDLFDVAPMLTQSLQKLLSE
jgi:electron transfer flavoprotein alpha subunit